MASECGNPAGVLNNRHAAMTDAVQRYLDGYALCVDGGYHHPDESERGLIADAVWGLLEDPDFKRSFIARHAIDLPDRATPAGGESHPDDEAVDRFAAAMKVKLAASRKKGRGGWNDPKQCAVETLATMLHGHTRKTNPGAFEDIGTFAMMLHQRGADPTVLGVTATPMVDIAGLRIAHQKLTELALGGDLDPAIDEIRREISALLAGAS